nr:tetratricopeptide repeat protein [Bacillus pseudomycoides]
MEIGVVTSAEYKLLQNWYHEMFSQHIEKARILKKEVDSNLHRIKETKEIFTYYSLLEFRYQMLSGNFENDLEGFEFIQDQSDSFLKYYYHFFKFIYATEVGNYSSAEYHYERAEQLLIIILDEAEKAEFHYRVALYYYYLSQPTLAINHVNKSLDFFNENVGYETKVGACKNTLGMACVTLGQFDLAEEYLVSALNTFQQENEERPALTVRYNLGLFYADQDLSELAIRHLTSAFKQFGHPKEPYQKRGTYVLAREHFKLGNFKEANFYVEEGVQSCTKEYIYHFTILKAMIENESLEKLEELVLEAISYFKEHELFKDIQVYTEELAAKWYGAGDECKAGKYFYMSYEAKNLLKEKGRLK